MTIEMNDRRGHMEDTEALRRLAQRVIRTTLGEDHITTKVNVGLTLVDDEEIRVINARFRDVDASTDVLSFPMTDYDLRNATAREMAVDIDPDTGELLLGDIVVSVERAREQAQEYGHSFEREFGYLVVHGMLHLLGYDHVEESDADVMRAMEEKVLGALALTREA